VLHPPAAQHGKQLPPAPNPAKRYHTIRTDTPKGALFKMVLIGVGVGSSAAVVGATPVTPHELGKKQMDGAATVSPYNRMQGDGLMFKMRDGSFIDAETAARNYRLASAAEDDDEEVVAMDGGDFEGVAVRVTWHSSGPEHSHQHSNTPPTTHRSLFQIMLRQHARSVAAAVAGAARAAVDLCK
jgi:hypothetical protein